MQNGDKAVVKSVKTEKNVEKQKFTFANKIIENALVKPEFLDKKALINKIEF